MDSISCLKIKLPGNTNSISTFLVQLLEKINNLKTFAILASNTPETLESMVLPVINVFPKLEALEKLVCAGPQLTIAPVLPTSLTYLCICEKILFPLTMIPFDETLSNIVQLNLLFTTERSLRHFERPLLFKLNHIKTFKAKGLVTENLPFITTFVSVNKSLTTLFLSLSFRDCDQLENLLKNMARIECFNLNFVDLPTTATSNSQPLSDFNLSRMLEWAFAYLKSLRVFLFNSPRLFLELSDLVQYLIYQYIFTTKHLDKIYVYDTGDIETFGDLMVMFFSTNRLSYSKWLPPGVELSDFCTVENLAPNNCKSGEGLFTYSYLRLTIDVLVMKKLYVDQLSLESSDMPPE